MPRRFKRLTLAPGVYQDSETSIELRAMSDGVPVVKRIPADTPLADAIRQREVLRLEALKETPRPKLGTLHADARRYLALQVHQASYKNKRAILAHWVTAIGAARPRHKIAAYDVLRARVDWQADGDAPKTINHRVAVLRHLYHVLDGATAKTPCDSIPPLHVPKTPIRRVPDATILAVDAEIQRRERHPPGRPYDGAKTRARFRVLVSTGRRPSEIMRAEPGDVDLEQRVWVVRDAKGGWSPGLYLNDDMLAAWTLFSEADAWGYFNVASFAVALRNAGWPKDIRPYQARHTTWITAVERGADMADVQVGAGHKSLTTTRQHYTGVRQSRMQRLSEVIDGRFGGFPTVEAEPQSEPQRSTRNVQNGPKKGRTVPHTPPARARRNVKESRK